MSAAAGHHIFFDPTGRRWRRLKLLLALTVASLVAMGTISWRRVNDPATLVARWQVPPPAKVSGVPKDLPEIGTGPLGRVVRVAHEPGGGVVAIDPLNQQVLHPIVGSDRDNVGQAKYALDHYGYSAAAHKTISLTFDDGPDPTWTPKVLDVLRKNHIQATFFVIGSEVVRHPNVVAQAAADGHAIGNHTFTHPALTADAAHRELLTTDRIIRATTGIHTSLFRMPYDGATRAESSATEVKALLTAERLGYRVSFEDFDTGDWRYGEAHPPTKPMPMPLTSMDNITVLLHDGGGNRAHTVAYLNQLIPWAKAHGYTFHSLPQVSQEVRDGTTLHSPGAWDWATFYWYRAIWTWPNLLLRLLFLLAVVSVAVGGLVNVVLALVRRWRFRRRFSGLAPDFTGPPVSVVIAAFNEEGVIAKTLAAVTRSRYRNIVECIVVNDGSMDRTVPIVEEMSTRDPRIRLLKQENAGKANALNRGFRRARGEVVVTLDADTIFRPDTVGNLVRHFALDPDGRLAVVSGVIKVGNLRRLLSRWQALEYVMQIGIDRGAQDLLHGIMVVPGACAAWRRDAVLHAGGYSSATLTEDCDMALTLQRMRYRVVQDDDAVCLTEVPESAGALLQQRSRWMYGNIQALWKHKRMVLNPRYAWLGLLTLPSAVLSVVVPIVFLPFVYAMAVMTMRDQGVPLLLIYGSLFLAVQFATAIAGVWLAHERRVHLWMVPLYRVIYEPLRAYLLYKTTFRVLRGTPHSWKKLQRLGSVPSEADEPVEVVS